MLDSANAQYQSSHPITETDIIGIRTRPVRVRFYYKTLFRVWSHELWNLISLQCYTLYYHHSSPPPKVFCSARSSSQKYNINRARIDANAAATPVYAASCNSGHKFMLGLTAVRSHTDHTQHIHTYTHVEAHRINKKDERNPSCKARP